MGRLTGKVAIVTGGASNPGLGHETAVTLGREGAKLVVTDVDTAGAEACAAKIRSAGGEAIAFHQDVTSEDGWKEVIARTMEIYGRLDVLVNNAGIAPVPPSLDRVTEELFDKTIAVNLKGPLCLSGAASQHMPGGSSIINISSVASLRPTPHTVVYAAAKAGLNVLTKAAAQEFGPRGIRVNAIVCGTFHTDSFERSLPSADMAEALAARLPLGRIASAEEIVGTALFLASDASSYMTGALLSLDGGVG
jgi:NAD(P)-dependent dehydrogenase (short-subunit alcohol dehydrogenase family)